MLNREELVSYCNDMLQIHKFDDYCPNGLQIEGAPHIHKIVAGVTASEALIRQAIARNADALLVHHGYFWKNETAALTGIKKNRIALLLEHNINLIAYHLPLDAHPVLGNNAQLARVLDIHDFVAADDLVFSACLSTPLAGAELEQRITQALKRKPLWVAADNKAIENITWCTGGAQSYIDQAIAKGADAFITGEVSESTVHIARENNIHFFAAGHHATERYGVQALAAHLADHFNLEQEFIDVDNPA